MPILCSVRKLQQIAITSICRTLVNFLNKHSSSKCKYCKLEYLNDQCHYLQNWITNALPQIGPSSKTLIYKEAYLQLYGEYSEYKDYSDRRFDTLYFLTMLCADDDLRIDYISEEDLQDFVFIKKFGKNIDRFAFNQHQTRNIDCFNQTLNSIVNLQTIKLYGPGFTDEIMESIGKYCKCVKELGGDVVFNGTFTPVGFLKLIFKDVVTKSGRNACCDSLEVIDIYPIYPDDREFDLVDGSKEVNPFLDPNINECLAAVFRNVPNLKSLQQFFKMDDLLFYLNATSFTSNKFKCCQITDLKPGITQVLKNTFPKLSELMCANLCDENIDELQLLTSFERIKSILLVCKDKDADTLLYNGFLYTELSHINILCFSSGGVNAIDMSHIARTMPSLDFLVLNNVKSITWDGTTYFKTLKNVSVAVSPNYEEENEYPWMKSFSRTISKIVLESQTDFPAQVLFDALKSNDCLEIEILSVTFLVYDFQKLKSFILECPKLRYVGNFVCENKEQNLEIQEYLTLNNIECDIDCFM